MSKRKLERFPLTLHHATNQWSRCFTLPGGSRKTVYFGTVRDAALAKYLTEKDDWQAGRNPREGRTTATTAISLSDLINAFLTRTKERAARGEISPRSFGDYLWTGQQMTAHFGRDRSPEQLTPTDFAGFRSVMADRYSPSRLSKTITVCRMMFRWAYEAELMEKPVRFGPDFKVAGKSLVRQHKAAAGAKLFAAVEITALLKRADEQMQAMILLGINAGLGNSDVASLPITALDLDRAVLDFPRGKTGVERKIPLWGETVEALRKVLTTRKPRTGNESLVFVTSRGGALLTMKPDGKRTDHIIERFRRLTIAAGIHRPRMGFYWLRHTTQTIGDEARDPIATAAIMGHADGSMGGHYRESISDSRLRAVTDHLHGWLYGGVEDKGTIAETAPAATDKPRLRVVG